MSNCRVTLAAVIIGHVFVNLTGYISAITLLEKAESGHIIFVLTDRFQFQSIAVEAAGVLSTSYMKFLDNLKNWFRTRNGATISAYSVRRYAEQRLYSYDCHLLIACRCHCIAFIWK